uniref:Uncharacterized protein n=1 Tax=Helianthus annuus TaxID=4232 RepID=A0A251SXM9_HELAN
MKVQVVGKRKTHKIEVNPWLHSLATRNEHPRYHAHLVLPKMSISMVLVFGHMYF